MEVKYVLIRTFSEHKTKIPTHRQSGEIIGACHIFLVWGWGSVGWGSAPLSRGVRFLSG